MAENQNPNNGKQADVDPLANAPKGPRALVRQANNTGGAENDNVLAKAPKGLRPRFGKPSPVRFGLTTPLWVRANQKAESAATSTQQRSLEDLYREHPDQKLKGDIEASTLNLAAKVSIQLVNEATVQWFETWCPHMKLAEVFHAIRVASSKEEENEEDGDDFTSNQFIVPHDAVDAASMNGTLAEMFRRCHKVQPEGGDILLPQLLRLLDLCMLFLGALRDGARKELLHSTKLTCQWAPVSLDAKKLPIQKQASADLEALNQKYEKKRLAISGGKDDPRALAEERQKDELAILETAKVEFETHRENFRVELLTRLTVLLAAAKIPTTMPDLPSFDCW
ncbi:hypothetical protein F5Y19DRAFT_298041 [Xylariaceae sp. FL1651]|nr:hypothetical protein F5Y19DRAFT_298041 [Xylariaceae sp. FL1651]